MAIETTDKNIQGKQRLRLRRFRLALVTYAVVILTTFMVTSFGLGTMSKTQWEIYIGLVVFGNAIFLALFISDEEV